MKITNKVGNAMRTVETFNSMTINMVITDIYPNGDKIVLQRGELHIWGGSDTVDIYVLPADGSMNGADPSWVGDGKKGYDIFMRKIHRAIDKGMSVDKVIEHLEREMDAERDPE